MEVRQLRYFIAVYDHGSTTKAAEALFVAQPSLSRQIRRLEVRWVCGCSNTSRPTANKAKWGVSTRLGDGT